VREGQLLARLESSDYEAQVSRAAAQLERAQADLAENERQLRQAERLTRDSIMSRDQMEAAQSRVRIAEAGVSQARADLAFAQASLRDTRILAPFTGTVVKKMAEVGESVAPIPPGVNISTSSGAVVALADLDTLEVETDVAESNVAGWGRSSPPRWRSRPSPTAATGQC
jgi:RND family efflux transporter MFP subunit